MNYNPDYTNQNFTPPAHYAPPTHKSYKLQIVLLFVALAIVSGLLIFASVKYQGENSVTVGRTSASPASVPLCTGYCTAHDLEVDIKATAQKRLDDRLGYGHVGKVFCVSERKLHYRCTVDYSADGVTNTTILNITVSPDHQRWIS